MDSYNLRVRIFYGIIAAVLIFLGLRLVQLQIIDSQTYTGASRDNAVREQRVLPARGAIYDRTGKLMVDNDLAYTITLTPRYVDTLALPLLADLLEVSDSLVQVRLDEARRFSAFQPSRSFPDVSFETFSRVQENQYRLPGVGHRIAQKRAYRTEARASHALGFVREITKAELDTLKEAGYRQGDMVGKRGLEYQYESFLRGNVGSEFKLVNVHGREVSSYRNGAEDTPPVSGYDVHLTLDSDLQVMAESLFVNKRGGVVAMDPHTGEVLALVSKPDFDLAQFAGKVTPELLADLYGSPENPLFNRALQSGMAPGSTWKPFMALMALAEGLITPTTRIHCPGYHPIGRGRIFRCMDRHGSIDVLTAIEKSCNTFFFELMTQLDVDTFSDYARLFGFGKEMPIDLPEQIKGVIPDSNYYNTKYSRGWTIGFSMNLGVGQGDMSVTPMQLARYVSAIATKGTLPTPHLVRHLEDSQTGARLQPDLPPAETIPMPHQHFDTVHEGMRRVMESGSGRLLQIPDLPSAGKTGTAENSHGENHSVFVMFAPLDDPQIALGVMVENAGFGSVAAGPIASLMAEQYLKGEISRTWERNFIINRLNETVSEPLDAPVTLDDSEVPTGD